MRQLYNVVEQCCALATAPLIPLALIQRALGVLVELCRRRHTHHAFFGDDLSAGEHFVTERRERVGDDRGRAELGPRGFGMAVQIAPPFDDLGFERLGQFRDALCHATSFTDDVTTGSP